MRKFAPPPNARTYVYYGLHVLYMWWQVVLNIKCHKVFVAHKGLRKRISRSISKKIYMIECPTIFTYERIQLWHIIRFKSLCFRPGKRYTEETIPPCWSYEGVPTWSDSLSWSYVIKHAIHDKLIWDSGDDFENYVFFYESVLQN